MADVETHLDAGILTITLNRPDKLNAISTEVLEQLSCLFIEAKNNSDVRQGVGLQRQ